MVAASVEVDSHLLDVLGIYGLHGSAAEWCFDTTKSWWGFLLVMDPEIQHYRNRPAAIRGGSWADPDESSVAETTSVAACSHRCARSPIAEQKGLMMQRSALKWVVLVLTILMAGFLSVATSPHL